MNGPQSRSRALDQKKVDLSANKARLETKAASIQQLDNQITREALEFHSFSTVAENNHEEVFHDILDTCIVQLSLQITLFI